jgi:acylphosphatase
VKHVKIIVSGKVQAVYFRENAVRRARKAGIAGLVRNEPNGTLYIEAEGSDEALETFIEWCSKGPRQAVVESIKVSEHPIIGHSDFSRA